MFRVIVGLAALGLIVGLISCSDPTSPYRDTEESFAVYSNSFEEPTDTAGWMGLYPDMFVDEPAPEGGEKSVLIGGSCIVPSAYMSLPTFTESGFYRLRCWGRGYESGKMGEVRLCLDDTCEPPQTSIMIAGDSWAPYTSAPVYVPAGHSLTVAIYAGGFIPNAIYLDLFEIERVEMDG